MLKYKIPQIVTLIHENSEPPDNPARVTNGQNKKSLEAFITNNFEAFLRGSWRIRTAVHGFADH